MTGKGDVYTKEQYVHDCSDQRDPAQLNDFYLDFNFQDTNTLYSYTSITSDGKHLSCLYYRSEDLAVARCVACPCDILSSQSEFTFQVVEASENATNTTVPAGEY